MRCRAMLAWAVGALAGRAEANCQWLPSEVLKISGEVRQGDLKGSFSRLVAPASGRFAESTDLGTVKRGAGFDGHLAWSRDVSGASHYLTSDFAGRLAVSEAWLVSHLACPAPQVSPISSHLGMDRATGLDVWRVTPRGGAPIELSYDRRSGRVDRAMLRYSENTLVHHYSDWRAVAPRQVLPFVQRDEEPEDESETIYTVRSVTRADRSSFARPLAPKDSRIVNGNSTAVPFEDDGGRRVYLPVYLNGKGPFAFELDNGGHNILTSETAKELGIEPQGSFSSTGAGNKIRKAGYVKLGKIQLGAAEMVDQTAKVLPLGHNERPGLPPRAGILGLEFFERFVVAIDHRKKTVSLTMPAGSADAHPGVPVRLLFDEDAPVVTGAIDGVRGNIMLDIGNAGATIVEDYWARKHGLTGKLLAGKKTDERWLSTADVRIGPFSLTREKIEYYGPAERGSESTVSIAGIAGEPLLARFNAVYDYARQKVWLDPLPEVSPRFVEKQP